MINTQKNYSDRRANKSEEEKDTRDQEALVKDQKMPTELLFHYILECLSKESVGVLATTSAENIPRATPVHFYADTDLKIYIMSDDHSIKLKNIETGNLSVSLAVLASKSYNPDDRRFENCKGMQITGVASIIANDGSEDRIHALKVYNWKQYHKFVEGTEPQQKIICINPIEIQLLDLTPEFAERFKEERFAHKQVWKRD